MARVLIVDDDDSVVEAWRAGLELDGHEVSVALSGTEAASSMRGREFDVVVTDLNMPDGGGMYVSGMTRMLQGHRNIIVVSGYIGGSISGSTRRDALANLGVKKFLNKPVELDVLRAAVNESLRDDPRLS